MVLSTFTVWYTYHLCLVPKHFHQLGKKPSPITHSAPSPASSSWQHRFAWGSPLLRISAYGWNHIMCSLLYLGNCIPLTVGYSQNPRRIIRNSGLGLLLTRMTVSRTHSFDTENFLFLSLLCGLFHSAIHISCLCPKLSKYIVICLA